MKVTSVSDALTLDGKLFQARGAATKNARSPIVVRHEVGVTRADVDEDRSLFLVHVRHTTLFARQVRQSRIPCRCRKTRTEEFKLYSLWHPQPVKVTE